MENNPSGHEARPGSLFTYLVLYVSYNYRIVRHFHIYLLLVSVHSIGTTPKQAKTGLILIGYCTHTQVGGKNLVIAFPISRFTEHGLVHYLHLQRPFLTNYNRHTILSLFCTYVHIRSGSFLESPHIPKKHSTMLYDIQCVVIIILYCEIV